MLVPNRPRCSKNCKTNSRFTASSLRSYSISNRKINILTTVKRIDIKLSPHPCLPHILSGRTGERHIVKANERGGLRWPEMDPEKHDVISIRVTEHHLEEPVDTAEQGQWKALGGDRHASPRTLPSTSDRVNGDMGCYRPEHGCNSNTDGNRWHIYWG